MNNEKLSTELIENMLINKQFYNINVEEIVESTNDLVKNRGNNGEKEGYVLIANGQTKGKGRLGRSFYSPSDSGIYMSILLRPDKDASKSLIITSAAAIAVCKAIREVTKKNAYIKWVNDILIEDKKVCGILTEGKINSEATKLDYAVVGIGINISKPNEGFPDDIKNTAAYLSDVMNEETKAHLISEILDNFYFYYNDIDLFDDVIRYDYIGLCGVIGKEVDVIDGDSTYQAKAIGIAEDMSLLIRNEDGVKKISSGEISIKVSKV